MHRVSSASRFIAVFSLFLDYGSTASFCIPFIKKQNSSNSNSNGQCDLKKGFEL